MKILAMIAGFTIASAAFSQSLDPNRVNLPWINADQSNAVYSMSDYPNGVHVFEAFQNFCGACNTNAPQVKAMYFDYQQMAENNPKYERVKFVDLGLDTRESEIRRWQARHNPPFPIVQDETRYVWSSISQSGYIPQTFVVDCTGTLIDSTVGAWDFSAKQRIRSAIETALQTVCE